MDPLMNSIFIATNESIDAVVIGLDVNENDTVLSICGSGDIPFALAERAKKIIAIDFNPCQIEFAAKRKDAILKGDYEFFLFPRGSCDENEEFTVARNEYFKNRLESIRKSAEKVEFIGGIDLFEWYENNGKQIGFSKVYLSNIGHQPGDILKLCDGLPIDSLIYEIGAWSRRVLSQDVSEIEIDRKLTDTTRKFKQPGGELACNWEPIIYRKIADAK